VRGYQIIRAHLSSKVNIVTAPSKFTLERIMDSGLFAAAQTKVIANTHGWSDDDLNSIHSKVCTPSDGKIRFLYLGRLEVEKGIVELCDAFVQISSSHPSIQLDVAGWGTLDTELRKRFDTHPNIHFLGMVNGKTKEEALSNTTIVIVPSLVDEVFGLVTIEALAFGKPVIASKKGGLPELIRQGETGWLVEPGDIQALSQQLEAVAKMDLLTLKKMSQLCMEDSYNFSMDRILTQYLDLYQYLLK
jgi:glycosyltransferase involved in cell wall biosynthesis